jgi:hypothetical protein
MCRIGCAKLKPSLDPSNNGIFESGLSRHGICPAVPRARHLTPSGNCPVPTCLEAESTGPINRSVQTMFKGTTHNNQRRTIRGSDITRQRRRLRSPEAKALYAAEIASCWICDLTPRQAGKLVGASPSYAGTAGKLSAAERASVHSGASTLSSYLLPQCSKQPCH